MEHLIQSSINMMDSLTSYYGAEEGIKFWDSLRENLPEEISHGLLIKMLQNSSLGNEVKLINFAGHSRVEGVKCLREIAGCGLKEALDMVKDLELHTEQVIKISKEYLINGNTNSTARTKLQGAGFVIG